MKKIILLTFLIFSIIGYSRQIDRCQILAKGFDYYDSPYVICMSHKTRKLYHFHLVPERVYWHLATGESYKIYFEGEGTSGLELLGAVE